ncbi:dephospho-CoA kinase [Nitratireductor sp. L1-7-SE]|uniref:Dephospho-CoA kinase n=1 Tax=Nitratireductor rhodophyticola TaxID=2854036 RepID=A0ABS7R751_9HYPH|nr:dephospho-CoA kinase [Nitratireductor rhodophyticola]MBY8916479.1 dephospho-CoA kinase [Nitratireductor rhodophyticola]MBY8921843.1 dephospho-CoA kinase [Nitratireductor rhodophyticola]
MTIVLGLTGSIGMGKSTTGRMFMDEGVPVHDSDAAVHRLYSGAAAPLIAARFPGTVTDGTVDRARLAEAVLGKSEAFRALEEIVHPLVRQDADVFVAEHRKKGTPIVVLDIPLLFETGGEDRVDRIVVVTAPAEEQRKRVLSRPGMTEEKFAGILARQVPDAEKRRRADFIIDTGKGMEAARKAVRAVIDELSPAETDTP